MALHAVIRARRPFAITMPALIQRDAAVAMAQHQADHVPGMGVEAAAMEEEDRSPGARIAPVQVMEPEALDDQIGGLRQHDLRRLQTRYFRHQSELFDFLSGFHGLASVMRR